ncbi:MAG: hypothetical protein K8T89_15030 [Planctomycetes bacterium]|nr:hypothetical protein [Planctomycetota bacterium]
MRWMSAVCVFAVCVAPAHANVKLAPIFADNMVLQRDMPVPIWGTAAASEAITVTFAGQKKCKSASLSLKAATPVFGSSVEQPRRLAGSALPHRQTADGEEEVTMSVGDSSLGAPRGPAADRR